jgi:hypothetical protein
MAWAVANYQDMLVGGRLNIPMMAKGLMEVTNLGPSTYHDSQKLNISNYCRAADATSHLFFSYLRSLAPTEAGVSGISKLPRSLQALLSQTEYPPETPTLMQQTTSKVVMIVESVSPTPFSLLRRARNFEYREDDRTLQEFSSYEDPVRALSDECRRVLESISSANQTSIAQSNSNGAVQDPSWSRFEDMGFSSFADNLSNPGDLAVRTKQNGISNGAMSNVDLGGRPTTPSWADFLSTGFPNDRGPTLMSPDQQLQLPVGGGRGHSSQSYRPGGSQVDLAPGELASIAHFDLDETFWWVWMTSLAGEETSGRKSVFGRCALIETEFAGHPWLLIEEQIKGASPGQEEGAYIAEKRSIFSLRGRLGRRKTTTKRDKRIVEPHDRAATSTPSSKIGPEQHAKIQQAAAQMAKGKRVRVPGETAIQRANRVDEDSTNRNSMLSIGPLIQAEASTALQWTNKFDSGSLREREKEDIRAQYLGDKNAGTGRAFASTSMLSVVSHQNGAKSSIHDAPLSRKASDRELPALPSENGSAAPVVEKSSTPPATPPKALEPSLPAAVIAEDRVVEPAIEEHPAVKAPAVPEPVKEALPAPTSASPMEEGKLEGRPAPKVSSPPKVAPKKLQKKENSGSSGFKKLFGRNRTTEKGPAVASGIPRPVVAAPTAAPPPVPTQVVAPTPAPVPIEAVQAAPVVKAVERSPPQSVYNDEPTFTEPPYEPDVHVYEHDDARQAALDKLEADREFSRFDQGPLEDMPNFVPEDESDGEAAPPPVVKPANNTRMAVLSPPEDSMPRTRSRSPMFEKHSEKTSDASVPVVSDRWAQIRKNAAERAQRMNDVQQAGRPHRQSRSDDGETSGEETIESRVARIKARVAELTGKCHTDCYTFTQD